MTFSLLYELDAKRVISGIINDSRSTISVIAEKDGNAIFAYIQAQIALVVPGVLCYRIIGESGNLGGYCLIQVQNGIGGLLVLQLRPAFIQFYSQISQIISTFITNGTYRNDYLY